MTRNIRTWIWYAAAWLAVPAVLAAQGTPSAAPAGAVSKMATMLFAEIDALVAMPALTLGGVAQVTGVAWTLDARESTPVFQVYRGSGAARRFVRSAEIRTPLPGGGAKGELLVLDLAPETVVTLQDIVARYGRKAAVEVPRPEAPPGEPIYYRFTMGAATVSFGVARASTQRLTSIVIDRTPPE